MFLYLYSFYMCLFFRSLILCACLHVLVYVSVFAAVMANKVHYYYYYYYPPTKRKAEYYISIL